MRLIRPPEWSRDHWTTIACAFTCLGAGGRLDPARLRLDGDRYPTRLRGTPAFEAGHNDIDCLVDAEAALAAPIVAYDRDNPPRLPATAFKPGERVMATDPDSGVTHSGTVSEHFTPERAASYAADGDDFEYVDGSSRGTLLRADILRLWPARLHRARLLQVATGADLDAASPCPRPAGESDAAFRERALATWVASGMAAEQGMGLDVPFTFGLSVKKRNAVARLLVRGVDWPEIARAAGWEAATLRRYYETEAAPLTLLNPYSDAPHLAQFIAAAH